MPDRKMFWRIVRRLFAAQRGRLFVVLLALGAGAAVTAALLNIRVDAASRLTKEFRAFGANVVVAPRASTNFGGAPTLDDSIVKQVRDLSATQQQIWGTSYLYVIADASVASSSSSKTAIKAVVAGEHVEFHTGPVKARVVALNSSPSTVRDFCDVGSRVAQQLHLKPDDTVRFENSGRQEKCRAQIIPARGDEHDSQVTVDLALAQRLASLPGKISLMQLSVTGTPREISDYIATLAAQIPSADVHGLRQFTDAEAKIYNRISGLLTATIALVLALTTLCVMAAMTNVAMERKNDVGLMRAIGGATRRVLRLFLAEAALLGLAGGLVGAAVGILFSIWLGRAVFGVAARPRLIVYPVAVALTIFVALISAYPLRRLANISPASVFRGEA
jgi:putative ABC transport system permease protein